MKLSALTVLFIRNGKHKMKSKGKSKMCNSETHATMDKIQNETENTTQTTKKKSKTDQQRKSMWNICVREG